MFTFRDDLIGDIECIEADVVLQLARTESMQALHTGIILRDFSHFHIALPSALYKVALKNQPPHFLIVFIYSHL